MHDIPPTNFSADVPLRHDSQNSSSGLGGQTCERTFLPCDLWAEKHERKTQMADATEYTKRLLRPLPQERI
jgi:hypothetical protein